MNALKTALFIGTVLAAAGQVALVHGQTLEERVERLEDARKRPTAPNPKSGTGDVTLEVSGHVNQALLWFEDGEESNLAVVDNAASQSRFRFDGRGRIDEDTAVGVRIEIGLEQNSTDDVTQADCTTRGDAIDLRQVQTWYRGPWGQFWLGHGATGAPRREAGRFRFSAGSRARAPSLKRGTAARASPVTVATRTARATGGAAGGFDGYGRREDG